MPPVIACINHLLAQEPWARQQLAPHAGKVACIDAGAFVLRLRVTGDGMLEAPPPSAPASVTIRLKLSDLPLMLQHRERAFAYVNIDGDADFANTLSRLSKTVRWEAEHELGKVVGQIAAGRIASGARAALGAARSGHQKLAENLAEFFLDEQPLLVRPGAVDEFSGGVTRLRDDVERAVKRLEKLEQTLARKLAPQVDPQVGPAANPG